MWLPTWGEELEVAEWVRVDNFPDPSAAVFVECSIPYRSRPIQCSILIDPTVVVPIL